MPSSLTATELQPIAVIPPTLAVAPWPAAVSTKTGRLLTARLGTIEARISQELQTYLDLLHDLRFEHRHGSAATDLASVVALLHQCRETVDLAIDRHLLQQRRSAAARGRKAADMRRRGLIATKGDPCDE